MHRIGILLCVVLGGGAAALGAVALLAAILGAGRVPDTDRPPS